MVLLLVCIGSLVAYSVLVFYYWYCWSSIPEEKGLSYSPSLKVSVIVPARNEEENISRLLSALQEQSYPRELMEIIVVDDHSTDRTAEIVRSFTGINLIPLTEENINSYKKKSIETGIAGATGEIIISTDADCIPGTGWVKSMVGYYSRRNAVFVAAPVSIDGNSSILHSFQSMDFMMLQAITGAAVNQKKLSMCNGANIAYSKKVFNEVNGFKDIDNIASGDDMLLMYKIWQQYPGDVYYLRSKEVIIETQPQKTWKAFFNQRIRWASKANKYEDKRFLPVLLLVYFFNLSFLVLLAAGYWKWVLIFWAAKTIVELPLFWSAAVFFDKTWAIKIFPIFQPLHIFYTIISGVFGQVGRYEWKGRRVR
ncbi:MAG TPA: glycosyltransferase [Chitinophagaceae bacterium]|nr:glycosyltransferase [Chitinophagaceae bacterium]